MSLRRRRVSSLLAAALFHTHPEIGHSTIIIVIVVLSIDYHVAENSTNFCDAFSVSFIIVLWRKSRTKIAFRLAAPFWFCIMALTYLWIETGKRIAVFLFINYVVYLLFAVLHEPWQQLKRGNWMIYRCRARGVSPARPGSRCSRWIPCLAMRQGFQFGSVNSTAAQCARGYDFIIYINIHRHVPVYIYFFFIVRSNWDMPNELIYFVHGWHRYCRVQHPAFSLCPYLLM